MKSYPLGRKIDQFSLWLTGVIGGIGGDTMQRAEPVSGRVDHWLSAL